MSTSKSNTCHLSVCFNSGIFLEKNINIHSNYSISTFSAVYKIAHITIQTSNA